VVVTVYYTAPYIWFARAMIVAFTILFLVLIARAWRRRRPEAEATA
jgi:hypothetical protein